MVPRSLRLLYLLFAFSALGGWGYSFAVQNTTAYDVHSSSDKDKTKAPPFQFVDRRGRRVTRQRYKGRWLLLNLWATWCPPCRSEMPALEALAHTMKKDLVLVAASVDTNWATIQRFVERDLKWTLGRTQMQFVWDPGARTSFQLGTTKFPETYLIDPQGQIHQKFIGVKAWNSTSMVQSLRRQITASTNKH